MYAGQAAGSHRPPHGSGKSLQTMAVNDIWALDIHYLRYLPRHRDIVQIQEMPQRFQNSALSTSAEIPIDIPQADVIDLYPSDVGDRRAPARHGRNHHHLMPRGHQSFGERLHDAFATSKKVRFVKPMNNQYLHLLWP